MPDEPPPIKVSIGGVELQEFLFSQTAARYALRIYAEAQPGEDVLGKVGNHIRGSLRLNRFATMNWLMMNGVTIPPELLDDRTHPEVGRQAPDQPV